MLMRSAFAACVVTLVFWLHGCGGDPFAAGEDAGESSGGSSGAGGHGGVTGGSGGRGGAGGGGGNGGSSTGGHPATGGSGGLVVPDSGPLRDAAAEASGSGGSVGIEAGSACGLAVSSASHTNGSNVGQLAWMHTVVGLNRLLVVALAIRHDNGMPNTIPSPLAVTYGGAPLVRLKLANDNYYQAAELWALVAPPLGANQVIVKFERPPQEVAAGVMSFTGASQNATFGAFASVAGGATSATLSVRRLRGRGRSDEPRRLSTMDRGGGPAGALARRNKRGAWLFDLHACQCHGSGTLLERPDGGQLRLARRAHRRSPLPVNVTL